MKKIVCIMVMLLSVMMTFAGGILYDVSFERRIARLKSWCIESEFACEDVAVLLATSSTAKALNPATLPVLFVPGKVFIELLPKLLLDVGCVVIHEIHAHKIHQCGVLLLILTPDCHCHSIIEFTLFITVTAHPHECSRALTSCSWP